MSASWSLGRSTLDLSAKRETINCPGPRMDECACMRVHVSVHVCMCMCARARVHAQTFCSLNVRSDSSNRRALQKEVTSWYQGDKRDARHNLAPGLSKAYLL